MCTGVLGELPLTRCVCPTKAYLAIPTGCGIRTGKAKSAYKKRKKEYHAHEKRMKKRLICT